MSRPEHAREIRIALADPVKLCTSLGLTKGADRQARGLLIRCVVHGEKNASCSVIRGRDGTVQVKCHACGFGGDALSLVAAVYGLDVRNDFTDVLIEAATIAGMHDVVAELRGEGPVVARERPVLPPPEPERPYPPAEEVNALWEASGPVSDDTDVSGMLVSRRLDPERVDALKLGRAIRKGTELPRWASKGGRSWLETGHRLLLRAFDANGALCTLRAWRVTDGDTPKRLPPAGFRMSGCVLANRAAVAMLVGKAKPRRVVFTEGEPDHLVRSLVNDESAVVGLYSGSWTPEFAERIPRGAEVVIRTHNDDAGDRYADAVARSIGERAEVWRLAP